MLRGNCLLNRVIEGNIEGRMKVTEKQGRRYKQLLDDLTGKRRYCELKYDALVHSCGGLVFEEAKDLFKTDFGMNE